MAKVILKKHRDKRILKGHLWVFDNEIERIEGDYEPGDIVDVYNSINKFLGRGYINPKSKIRVRIMTRKQEEIDREFFKKRIENAWEYRKRLVDTSSCRVIFGEADFIPALIVDKFSDYLVVQTLALGIDKYKDMIVELLDEIIKPKGIFERNDVPVRELEGLEQRKGFLKGTFDTKIEIVENGIKMVVDIENGQKTGYFLDQRENRAAIKPLVKDARVLDTFTHTGGFALHAAHYGAKEVIAVDISEHAIDYVNQNAKLNGFEDKIQGVVGNVFDVLRDYHKNKEKFDVVILDPPAFCKSRSALEGAYRGYKEINLRAMKIIKPGGFLVTCSCSHYMTPELFMEMIQDAAKDAKKTLRQIEVRTQAKDHPILLGSDESLYLKCVIVQVI
ncbi:class I SAM-dependent rRNA methyltransferase [Caloranaerobacter azorensis]|uniref:23S rRNA (Cytosine1962-C5)-methyltransferase n=2 Tax=Caloranaerobacter azorensis TaxID=116090 RepID=A0A1M5W9A5_9FIRM|nr:class I SAM-dependent rRNA methyltransferase [Caloranaerobacter azorensis]QIB27381.1 class I SAM-dependent rRNA methyltransferase [Caloranaerobacter azorensis]SHH84159.1 23S rRNA (cytosine1962-C5)-methyltransferase [Caloranaerobacter azorensis DSM 13643]